METQGRGVAALLDRTYTQERIAALSDGVFAIALTLLVLDLKIPEVAPGMEQVIRTDLSQQLPSFVAWTVSFVLIARFWLVHHALLQHLSRCKVGTLVVNFWVLALISVIPFGASLIGTYEFDLIAIVVFSVLMAATGLSVGLFARHVAVNRQLHRPEGSIDPIWHWRYHAVGLPLFAAFAVALAWIHHPGVALATWILEPFVALGLSLRRA